MKTISEYKDMALQSLEGKWGKAAIASIIAFIILELFGSSPSFFMDPIPSMVLQGVFSLLLLPLVWGHFIFFLRLIRDENLDYGHLFDGFNQYFRIFLAELLKGIYILLWALLLIIPGLIKEYSYAMTEFILKDNPEMSGEEAICESMRLMQGHKMQLFLLDLSMIGWLILSILTLGIGFLFLLPYNYTAHAHFYEDLKAKQ
jgi:uncharacterized membrane protein